MSLELVLSIVPTVLILLLGGFLFKLMANMRSVVDAQGRQLTRLCDRQATDMGGAIEKVDAVDEKIATVSSTVSDSFDKILNARTDEVALLRYMEGSLGGIRDYLSEKGNESKRLREGHDYAVLKNFCKQVIRCVHQIDVARSSVDEVGGNVLNGIRMDLIDLLDRNGIEEFSPELGQEYAGLRAFAEVSPVKELTTNNNQVGKVAGVVRPGFRYVYNHDQVRVIIPAQVKVFAKGR